MSSDRKVRVDYLKKSLDLYRGIIDYVYTEVPVDLRPCFEKELELTREMIVMMPTKIDKINPINGQARQKLYKEWRC